MSIWRFGETAEDGEAWMANPTEMHVYVDYWSRGEDSRDGWRRLMVVTRSWLDRQLADSDRLLLPALLVLPDASRERMLNAIEDAVASSSLDPLSKRLSG